MTTQDAITQIQRLHRKGAGLNINAVKREFPELLQHAFSQTPFLGWKRLLEKSGLSYANITIKLEEYTECMICGKHFKSLPYHIIKLHEWELSDYTEEFPDSKLMSEGHAVRLIRERPNIEAYWEPIWSREHVLDRFWFFYEKGIPINSSHMRRHDESLYAQAVQRFRGIEPLLAELGLDKFGIVKKTRRFSCPEDILRIIRERYHEGLPMNAAALSRGEHQDGSLLIIASREFGNLEKAIDAAGLNAKEIGVQARIVWTKDMVLKVIKERARQGKPLGAISIRASEDITAFNAARNFFPSWRDALEAAGLNATYYLGNFGLYQEKEQITIAIRRRYQLGQSLLKKKILKTGLRQSENLVTRAEEEFGTWNKAVEKALRVITQEPWTRERVIKKIQQRADAGLPLGALAMQTKGNNALRYAAQKFFASWREAVCAAGLESKLREFAAYSNKGAIVTAIRRRHRLDLSLRKQDVLKLKQKYSYLVKRAEEEFGSWSKAVKYSLVDSKQEKS